MHITNFSAVIVDYRNGCILHAIDGDLHPGDAAIGRAQEQVMLEQVLTGSDHGANGPAGAQGASGGSGAGGRSGKLEATVTPRGSMRNLSQALATMRAGGAPPAPKAPETTTPPPAPKKKKGGGK